MLMLYLITSIHFFSLPFPAPLSMNFCLQNSFSTILLFSTLYMPKPSQSGLLYFVRDARYSEDAMDVIISFFVSLGKAKDPS